MSEREAVPVNYPLSSFGKYGFSVFEEDPFWPVDFILADNADRRAGEEEPL